MIINRMSLRFCVIKYLLLSILIHFNIRFFGSLLHMIGFIFSFTNIYKLLNDSYIYFNVNVFNVNVFNVCLMYVIY